MYAAIDIGGTKTLVAAMNNKRKIVESIKFPTPKDYSDFKGELETAIKNLKTKDFKRGVVAIPGLVNRKHGVAVKFGNLPWENVHIQRDVEHALNCPITLENDANLAGLGEAHELPKYKAALYITISTGIGGGYIYDLQIDPRFEDSEIGHQRLDYKGHYMKWEKFASGSAIFKKYGKKASDINSERTWNIITKNMAVGIYNLIATMNPDVIIIGGGVGSHFNKFKKPLLKHLKHNETPMVQIPSIVKAKHPEEAVLYGCYYLAKQHEN